jgi:hypothetical protein
LDRRLANRWQLGVTYLATRKNMWITGVPFTPNEEFFPRNETWETTFRTSGSYRAPWGILASTVFEYQSGAPLARTVLFRTGLKQLSTVTLRMEPLGAIRLPGVKLLNLRVSKQIVSGNQRYSIDADLYNAMNTNDATAMTVASGPAFGRITAIVPPRVARIGFTYHF